MGYRFYYKVLKKNEIKNQSFLDNKALIKPKKIFLTSELFQNESNYDIYKDGICFNILNTKIRSDLDNIWARKKIPELISFNLNYLGFLSSSLPIKKKLFLFEGHIDSSKKGINRFSYEPFVISLKLIESIRFLTLSSIKEIKYDNFLFSQAKFLSKRLEKDLMGNHFLFNGLGLLYAAYYFGEKGF